MTSAQVRSAPADRYRRRHRGFVSLRHRKTTTMNCHASLRTRHKTATACLVLVLLIVLAVSAVFAPRAAAATEESAPTTVWSLTPAQQDDTEERVSFRFDVPPGETVDDAVELTNFSAREATFTLTAADGVVSDAGAFDILRPVQDRKRVV